MTTIPGIDVSGIGQGADFDWSAWRGRIDFAFAKATEGLTFKDATFPRNRSMMHALGIVAGAYHFLHPELNPIDQAEYFLTYAAPVAGELIMVDVEINGGKSAAEVSTCVGAFAAKVRTETGAWPVAYTDPSLAEIGALNGAAQCPGFIANPSHSVLPTPIGPWRLVSFEQTGQRGVDSDVFFGTVEELKRLTVPVRTAGKPLPAVGPAVVAALDLGRAYESPQTLPVVWLKSTDGGRTYTRS